MIDNNKDNMKEKMLYSLDLNTIVYIKATEEINDYLSYLLFNYKQNEFGYIPIELKVLLLCYDTFYDNINEIIFDIEDIKKYKVK
jgi:hypothetical protein